MAVQYAFERPLGSVFIGETNQRGHREQEIEGIQVEVLIEMKFLIQIYLAVQHIPPDQGIPSYSSACHLESADGLSMEKCTNYMTGTIQLHIFYQRWVANSAGNVSYSSQI